jgi:uncharacterized protein
MAKVKGVKRQPQRSCIICHRTLSKRELTRIVRTPAGEIAIDPTGKIAGRGAYLCSDVQCWLAALQQKRLEHALKVTLTAEQQSTIAEYAARLSGSSGEVR